MRTKPDTKAIVGFKPCPKCGGRGSIPCDGMEYHRTLHETWAKSFHLLPVLYNWAGKELVPGIAVAELKPGGWWALRVYVKASEVPSHYYEASLDGYQAHRLDGRGVPHPLYNIGELGLRNFDIINEKAFWHVNCSWPDRENLKKLDYLPECIGLEDRKMIEVIYSRNEVE